MPRPKSRILKIKVADIDRELLPPQARTPGSALGNAAFHSELSGVVRKHMRPLGGTIEALAWTPAELTVTWQPPAEGPTPLGPLVQELQAGQLREAAFVMELLLSADGENTDLLYNLGMAYSDLGRLDRAVALLRKLVTLDPAHINGRVALGVALTRQARFAEAEMELRRAVQDAPDNPWAHRNLGACLMNLDRPDEAVQHLRLAVGLNPQDERAWLGLGKALELANDLHGADEAYRRAVELDETGPTGARAKQALSKLAGTAFSGATPGMPRMDAVMYCLGALERFEKMAPADVQKVAHEIALLGMNGIDVNDPGSQYKLRSLPGEFSGLQLVCLEYVAFKQVAPQLDIGFDLGHEYKMAQTLYEARGAGQK